MEQDRTKGQAQGAGGNKRERGEGKDAHEVEGGDRPKKQQRTEAPMAVTEATEDEKVGFLLCMYRGFLRLMQRVVIIRRRSMKLVKLTWRDLQLHRSITIRHKRPYLSEIYRRRRQKRKSRNFLRRAAMWSRCASALFRRCELFCQKHWRRKKNGLRSSRRCGCPQTQRMQRGTAALRSSSSIRRMDKSALSVCTERR